MQNYYPNPNPSMYGGYAYANNNTYHMYGQPMVKAPNNQILTPEQQNYLMGLGSNGKLDLTIDPDTMLKAGCAHKDINTGESTVTITPEGKCHCAICDAQWNMFEGSAEDVKAAVDKIADIIQTTKLIYADASDTVMAKYLQPMDPLLQHLPNVWNHAVKSFGKYEDMNINPMMNRVSMNAGNYFNNYNTMVLTGGYGYNPMPGYGQMNPQMAYPQMNNPMGYAPQNGVMPNGQPVPNGMMPNGQQYWGNPMVDPQMVAAQNGVMSNGQPVPNAMMPNGQFNAQQFAAPMANNQTAPVTNPMVATPAPAPCVMPAAAPAPATTGGEVIQQQKVYHV